MHNRDSGLGSRPVSSACNALTTRSNCASNLALSLSQSVISLEHMMDKRGSRLSYEISSQFGNKPGRPD